MYENRKLEILELRTRASMLFEFAERAPTNAQRAEELKRANSLVLQADGLEAILNRDMANTY